MNLSDSSSNPKVAPLPHPSGDLEEAPPRDEASVSITPKKESELVSTAIPPPIKDGDTSRTPDSKYSLAGLFHGVGKLYVANDFPINIIFAIVLARAYPPLGAEYLQPDITAGWIAVAIIFILAGMGLKTSEFSQAFKRIYFNSFVQFFSFGIVSLVIFAASRSLTAAGLLNQALGDGMIICACLPMAINVVIILSAATGGDEAAAIFNSTFANIVGIFLSPILIKMYLGSTGDVSLPEVFLKLTLRVILPLVFGQLLQGYWAAARAFYLQHKRYLKKVSELALVYIVYTVFCRTFSQKDTSAGLGDVFLMIFCLLVLMIGLMAMAWYSVGFIFRDEPTLRAMGVFGCVHKTVSLGVPLINSIYGGSPNEGLYTLPILIWHPMQLVVGSMLVSRISKYVESEVQRLEEQKESDTGTADVEAARVDGE